LALLALGVAAARAQSGANLIQNPDFTGASSSDVIWDGVDSGGRLQVPVIDKEANIGGAVGKFQFPCSPAVVDVTGDGVLDLVVADSSGFIWVFKNSGTKKEPKWTHGEIIPVFLHTWGKWTWREDGADHEWAEYAPQICAANLTRQGVTDLFAGSYYGELFQVTLQLSGGKLRPRVFDPNQMEMRISTEDGYWANLLAPAVFDWDKDGRSDLILGEGTFSANSVWFLKNEGSDTAPRFKADDRQPIAYGNGRDQLRPVVVDWDNDGTADLLVADSFGEVRVFLNKKAGSVGLLEPGDPPMRVQFGSSYALGGMVGIALGDLNEDGLFDLVIGRTTGRIQIALNTGTPGNPKFGSPVDQTGTDVIGQKKAPTAWRLSVHEGKPYTMVEQVVEADNAPGAPGTGRSGKECAKVSFYKPVPDLISDPFPVCEPGRYDILWYSPGVDLQVGKAYTVSFWYKMSGFEECSVHVRGKERAREARKSRRGESMERPVVADNSYVEKFPSSTGWRQMKYVLRIKGVDPSAKYNHWLSIRWRGYGELWIDDLSIVEN
jgi:hypothetical protein